MVDIEQVGFQELFRHSRECAALWPLPNRNKHFDLFQFKLKNETWTWTEGIKPLF